MNRQNPILAAIFILAGAISSLLIMLSVLLSHGNALAHLCFYLLIGGGLLGLLVPRVAFFVWVVTCGYSDLLKRLAVVFGEVTKQDLLYVLGISPVMFSGIVISLVIGGLTGVYIVRLAHWLLLLAGLFLMLLTAVIDARAAGGSLMAAVQGVVNGGLYSLLLFAIPVLFPYPQQMLGFLRFCLWAFLPVALYGIVQQVQGFQPFEIAYLRTGLSIEIQQLILNRVRAFSTLNSPTALGSVSGIFVVLAWFLSRQPQPVPRQQSRWIGRSTAGLMMVCYTGSLIASTGRTCAAIIPVAILAAWCFRKPARTVGFYVGCVTAFVVLVAVSPWLLSHLEEAMDWSSSHVKNNDFVQQFAVVGTYYDRLHGFAHVLRNQAAYSSFGMWDGRLETLPSNFLHHDILSLALLRIGVVPLLVLGGVLTRAMLGLHRKLYRLEDRNGAAFMALAMGQILAMLMVSLIGGNVLIVFPVNVFFWMFAATAVLCTQPLPKPAPSRPAGSTGLDIESLAGRTPGAKRFSPSQATL